MTSNKNIYVILQTLGAIFLNQTTLDAIFPRNLPKFSGIFQKFL